LSVRPDRSGIIALAPGAVRRRRRQYRPGLAYRVLRATFALASWLLLVCGALAAAALSRFEPVAITLGQTTLFLEPMPDPVVRTRLRVHEAVHRLQFERHGFFRFIVAYVLDADRRLAWEAEARAANLCRARDRWEFIALERVHVEGLRGYAFRARIPESTARAYLRRAYDDGRACPALLAAIARSTPLLAPHLDAGVATGAASR
jgi:hypothetical protein